MNYELPADMRERLRLILDRVPHSARCVYNRENIRSKDTPLRTIVETVVYYFDGQNQQHVAERLNISHNDMMILFIGYLLGRGE